MQVERFLAPTPVGRLRPGSTPSFSVVVAAHQAAGTIGEAIDSALGQTRPPHEIIVCDDGSTDDLDTALAPYAGRIVLLRQENAGEGAAKNAGVGRATGDYVVFLDADDIFLPKRLEALGELAAARPDLDVLTTDAFLEVDGTAVRRCYEGSWRFEVNDQRRAILERNFVFGLAAVRRTRFLDCGGFDRSIRYPTADWDLWCRMILGGSRVGLVTEPLARYRLHPGSLSAQRARLLRGRCVMLEKTATRVDLSPDEREKLRAGLERQRRAALLAEASEAIRARAPGARRLAVAVATGRSIPLATRLRALAAAVAPRFASKRLARAEDSSGVLGPAGVRFPA